MAETKSRNLRDEGGKSAIRLATILLIINLSQGINSSLLQTVNEKDSSQKSLYVGERRESACMRVTTDLITMR